MSIVTIKEIVDNWWNSLDEIRKEEIMECHFPNEAGLIDSDELFMRLEFEEKYLIYATTDDEVTEVDLEAQATDAAERENHRREVEGEIE